jgi:FtsZ-interacting cell division protein ZipA
MTALAFLTRYWKLILIGAGTIALVTMLLIAKADARHWQKRQEATQAAFDKTVADYRAAAEKARAADLTNAQRVKSEQQQITQEVSHDYETRLADARKRADDLRLRLAAQANPRPSGAAQLPTLPAPAGRPDETPADGFPVAERLKATEQAIQLDELISWVERQARVDVQGERP